MKTVLCTGCFDIFHVGHLRYLKAAKRQGDYLIVAVTSDKYVNKGPGRPVFGIRHRMEILQSLSFVDRVVSSNSAVPIPIIKRFRPHVYVKGAEYRGRLPEQELVESLGGRVHFTNDIVFSSTALCSKL